ncbi:MAG: hypothetical protein M3004_02950 [Bacteroidota bacterium]|nr:hypothetical protein [Bacteroidota bacterium]
MKKFYTVKFILAILYTVGCSLSSISQTIISGGAPAKFGIDADVKANVHLFGTSMPAGAGSHDWFTSPGGSGIGVIDTTGASVIKTRLQAGQNFLFDMPMAFNRFQVQDGIMMLDARFAHDNVGIDSTTFGSAKNADDPTTWATNPNGSSILDKCDIVDTYIHLRRNGSVITGPNPSPLILIMGGSVYSSNGTHYMDFELFKQKMSYNRSTGKFINSGPSWTGGHTRWEFRPDNSVDEIGDMQISFSFSGTAVSSLNIYIWVSKNDYQNLVPQKFDFVANSFYPSNTTPNYGYAEITSKQPGAPLPVWGVVNTAASTASPYWGSFSKNGAGINGYTASYGAGEFCEVAVDLTALGTDPAFNPYNNPCNPPFSRMIAKTRASSSFSAALKDFTGPYSFVADPMIPPDLIQPNVLACNVPTVNINPLSVYPSPAVYEWATRDGNILTRTDSTGITVNKQGTYVLKTRSYIGCSSLSDSVIVSKDDYKPVANAGGTYYLTALNPIALLQGGNVAASNYLTPFGYSSGLDWDWTGPNSYHKYTQYSDAEDTGKYTLTVTEKRNGCTASAVASVVMLQASSPLAVKLTNFAGILSSKNTVDLKWTTATEDGTENYILERSIDGINFSKVYTIHSAKNSNESNYGYRDDVTGISSTGVIYYRIKMYTHSALYSISKIVKINFKSDLNHGYITSVVQNAKSNATVNYYSVISAPMNLAVSDVDGKILYTTQTKAVSGINTVQIPVQYLQTIGLKVVEIIISAEKFNYKFISN